MDCRAFANVKSQSCERLTVFSLQLLQEPWVPENSFCSVSSVLMPKKTRLRDEERSKVLVGKKNMRCEGPNSQILELTLFVLRFYRNE